MIRRLMLAYLAGLLTVLGYAYHQPDAAVSLGLKLAAFQTSYAYDARPVLEVDEATMVAELARPVPPKGKRR